MSRPDFFQPDFVVRAADRPETRIAVEIKAGHFDLEEAVHQLREYMQDTACPLGLLVTPRETQAYQEELAESPVSIHKLASVETQVLLGVAHPIEGERELGEAVRQWLENLCRAPHRPRRRNGELGRLERSLLPAMLDAQVAQVGPR